MKMVNTVKLVKTRQSRIHPTQGEQWRYVVTQDGHSAGVWASSPRQAISRGIKQIGRIGGSVSQWADVAHHSAAGRDINGPSSSAADIKLQTARVSMDDRQIRIQGVITRETRIDDELTQLSTVKAKRAKTVDRFLDIRPLVEDHNAQQAAIRVNKRKA
jgi:hypothetical protein